MDPVFYYGCKKENNTWIPFVRPLENSISLDLFNTQMELNFSFTWDKEKETWKKVPMKRIINVRN